MGVVTQHRVNGVSVAVHSWGPPQPTRTPLVLVPGTGATAADWTRVAENLDDDRTVLAVDLRGHGRSDWPGTYTIDLMAEDLRQLLPHCGDEVDLVGHSLGGLVALRALDSGAPTARRLVLEDVGLPRPRRPSKPARPAGDLEFDWAVVEQVRPEIDEPAAHWPSTVARLELPTLVIGGGPRSFVPQESVSALASLVAQGQLLTIDAGHEIHTRRPDEFVRALRAFLDT